MAPISSAVTDWAAPTGDLPNTRHSALAQITPGNVGRLQLAWHSATGAPRGQEGGPLVIGDTLYLHSPFPNQVVALNLADQSVRWTCEPHQDATVVPLMCCDVVSRGLAYGHGKIFLQQADATLVALDARTGARLWQAHNGDARRGATATNAPQVFDRYVVTGISSGEYGVRGYSVGPDADLLIDPARDRAALERRAPGRCSTARSMRA
jgi:glucose dehydrogenase